MSTPAQRAAFRVFATLGARTVYGVPPPERNKGGRRNAAAHKLLHERIMELIGQGLGNRDIALEVGVSPQSVGRHRRGQIGSGAR